MLAMLIMREIMTKFASLQGYPKEQIIYFAHRAVTLWVVGIST